MEPRTNPLGRGGISRRNLLLGLPAMGVAGKLIAQGTKPTIPVRALNHMTLTVTDVKRSVEFYQGLFGMPVQSRQGSLVALRIGAGPQCVAISAGGANSTPGINHFCVTTENFSVDRIKKILAEHGVTENEAGAARGAMKFRVRMRGEKDGGAKEGTPEFYVGDPDGITVQIQDTGYCGGAGRLGNVCPAPEPSPSKGLLALRDLSHFTIFVSDQQRSMDFYQGVFAMPIQAHQGPTPLLGVGPDRQFLTIVGAGGRGGATFQPDINHVSFRMEGFDPDQVLKKLTDFGVKPRGDARGKAGPLVSYVTMRGPERGGAKDGTPELYFTDPDGILLQIQDVSYCGGAGHMGEVCP